MTVNPSQVLPTELPLFVREYRSGTYSIGPWYLAKALIEVSGIVTVTVGSGQWAVGSRQWAVTVGSGQ